MTGGFTARLVFVGGGAPVLLAGAERGADRGEGYTYLAGRADPDVCPAGDLCLARVEWGGETWAVADANVDVSNRGTPRDRVTVSWRTGHELPPLDEGTDLSDAGLPWLLRARTLRLVGTVELVDRIARYAMPVASGYRDPQWVRRLAQVCAELRSRYAPGARPVPLGGMAADEPSRVLHEVFAAGGHLAMTAGSVRARLGESLSGMELVTLPRALPADPETPVLLVDESEPTVGILRASEEVAAEEWARLNARAADGGEVVPAVAGAVFGAARDRLLSHCGVAVVEAGR